MPCIFVETENSVADPSKKLFSAVRTGGAAPKAEAIMQKVVKRVIGKAPGFTILKTDKAKGYAIRLSVAKVEVAAPNTKCSLSGSIVRYPVEMTEKRGAGEVMVSTGMTGSATASGTGERSVLDCVEAIAEDLVTKSIQYMQLDFVKR